MAVGISKSLALKLTVNSVQFAKGLGDAKKLAWSFSLSITSAASTTGRAFLGLASTIGTVRQLLADLANVATQPLTLAAAVEDAHVTFGVMLGDMEKAVGLIQDIQQFADVTPFQSPELIRAGRILLATGTEAEQMIDTVHRLGDIAAGVNAPVEDVSLVFAKAHARGRLMVRDINQWVARGIPIMKELQKVKGGIDGAELRKQITAGKVGFNDLAQAVMNMTNEGGKFFQMTAKRSQTLSGLWSTVSDLAGRVFQRLGEQMAESLGLKNLQTRLIEFLLWARDNIRAYVKPGLDQLGDGFLAVWSVAKMAWEQFGQPAFAAFVGWIRQATGGMPTLADVVFLAGQAIAEAANWALVSWRRLAVFVVENVHLAILKAAQEYTRFGIGVAQTFGEATATVSYFIGIVNLLTRAFTICAGFVVKGFQTAFGFVAKGIQTVAGIVGFFGGFVVKGIMVAVGFVVKGIQVFFGMVASLAEPFVSYFTGIWSGVGTFIMGVFEGVAAFWGKFFGFMIRDMMKFVNFISQPLAMLDKAIRNLAPDLAAPFRELAAAGEGLASFEADAQKMLEDLKSGLSADNFGDGAGAIKTFFADAKAQWEKMKGEKLQWDPLGKAGDILDPSLSLGDSAKKVAESKKTFAAAMERGSKEAFSAIAAFKFGGERTKTQAEYAKQQVDLLKKNNDLLKKQNDLIDALREEGDEGGELLDLGFGAP